MHGPNTNKRIMTTIGPRKGRNNILQGRWILFDPIPAWISELRVTVLRATYFLENIICMFLYNA
jgi:hypothetical protein